MKERHSFKRLWNDLIWVLSVLTLASAAFTLIGFFAPQDLWIEILSYLRLQYLVVGIVAIAVFAYVRKPALFAIALFVAIANALVVFPYIHRAQFTRVDGAALKILLMNVHAKNVRYEEVLKLIRDEDASVVAILEVNSNWQRALEELKPHYHYRVSEIRVDDFGIAVLSRIPFMDSKVDPLDKGQPPSILVTFPVGAQTIKLLATHPVPPVRPEGFQLRNQQLKSIASSISSAKEAAVVLADLNTPIWSKNFQLLLQDANLRDVRESAGLLLTWPQGMFPLYLPIDHCLISPGLAVADVRRLSTPGSDHFGIAVSLTIPRAERAYNQVENHLALE